MTAIGFGLVSFCGIAHIGASLSHAVNSPQDSIRDSPERFRGWRAGGIAQDGKSSPAGGYTNPGWQLTTRSRA